MEMANRRSKEMVNSTSEKSSLGIGNTVVEDKTVKSDHADDEEAPTTTSMEIINKQVGGHVEREAKYSLKLPSPTGKDKAFIKQEDDEALRSAKAEMGEVREENERLKLLLSRIVKDYQSLQMHFLNTTLQKEEPNKKSMDTDDHKHHEETSVSEVDELVSLSLGRTSSSTMTDQQYQPRKDNEIHKKNGNLSSNSGKDIDGDQVLNEAGLALELGCRFEPAAAESTEIMMKNSISSDNSSGVEPKEEDPTEIWPPSKMLKTARSGDDEVSQQTHLKKARVSVRARCDAPTMNDGCQWRKYGQKIAKGNPCPRAYYRCTVSPSCPVRKQVQRCADDMSILITTYEGTHNHPLPISATAMASTTSAAASMLQSHSSTSEPGFMNSATAPLSTSTHSNLHGLNFTSISQNSRPPHHFYFPNSSITTTNSHPTITLDLTTPSSSSHFGRFPSSGFSSTPRSYPSTCLNFSSSSSSSLDHMNTLLQAPNWNNNHTAGYFNYGALLSQNRSSINQVGSSLNIGKNPFQEPNNFYQSYTQQHQKGPHQQFLTETIATATKAITSNPKFQSALAAALTSFVGNGGGSGDVRENHSAAGSTSESSGGIKLKWGEPLNGIGCASSYLNKSS